MSRILNTYVPPTIESMSFARAVEVLAKKGGRYTGTDVKGLAKALARVGVKARLVGGDTLRIPAKGQPHTYYAVKAGSGVLDWVNAQWAAADVQHA